MNKLIIIDGYSLLFRGYYATAYNGEENILKTSNGTPINAILTFANMVLPLITKLNKNESIFIALDSGKETNRHKIYPEYKINRQKCPESLKLQMPILREFLNSFNIPYLEQDGIEGDDIAGSFAALAYKNNIDVDLYTSDKDYLQLVNKTTNVYLLKQGMKNILKITLDNFYDNYQLTPKQIIDYKGLRGDSSDNLKGIPGIGDKTAITLLHKYGSLEEIIKNTNQIGGKLSQNINEYKELGILCKQIATIETNLFLNYDISNITYKGTNINKANEFIKKYELNSLVNKITKLPILNENNIELNNNDLNYKIINDSSHIKTKKLGFAIDFDYNSNYHNTEIYGFCFYIKNELFYINYTDALKDINFKNILEDPSIEKYCFDSKSIYYILKRINIDIKNIKFDILLASYMLDSSNSSDIITTFLYFGINLVDDKKNKLSIPLNIAKFSLILSQKITQQLKENNEYQLYSQIELPLSYCLANMEYEGFPVDKNVLLSLSKNYENKIISLTNEIYNLAGEQFNIDSPKQVSEILFNKLHLNSNNKLSTSIDYLKYLVNEHPIIEKIIQYRKYSKLINTYTKGLLNYINDDNKIHCIFNQAITATGRLSSSEPNMQNITVRDQESKEIRKAFFYKNDLYEILSYDYSQIELRILASLSNCKNLINAFNNNIDIHKLTAQKIFNKEEINDNERRIAKAVNFGIIYGISDYGLKEQIEVSLQQAKEFINKFFETYPEIKVYMNNQIKFAKTNYYVETMFKRKRYIQDINSTNFHKREFAKRVAYNAPIQGSAADIIKIVMIKIDELLKNYDSKLVLQIHDELIFKLNLNEKNELLSKIKDIMENTIKLNVKLIVNGGHAKNWYDIK